MTEIVGPLTSGSRAGGSRLTGVAVVTGAGRGIGSAIARRLADDGARVAVLDLDASAARLTCDELQARGHDAHAVPVDLAEPEAIEAAVEEVEATLGPVEYLVSNAGVLRPGALLETSAADWAHSFAVNVTAVFLLARTVAAGMLERQRGSIVTVSSNAASTPRVGMGAYCASKAASTMLTRCLGLELAGSGIRCNTVSPGSTETPMLHSLWTSEDSRRATLEGSLTHHRTGIPLGRIAEPADIAAAVAFLLSDDARHITMHDLRVDGGATLGAPA